jgi:hypothetical protein
LNWFRSGLGLVLIWTGLIWSGIGWRGEGPPGLVGSLKLKQTETVPDWLNGDDVKDDWLNGDDVKADWMNGDDMNCKTLLHLLNTIQYYRYTTTKLPLYYNIYTILLQY